MPREKKEAKNFGCKLDASVYEKLEEFCKVSGQNKTMVVERAILRYVEENLPKMKEISKTL